ncbi:MAG: hypothetical protein CBC13_10615 [Planctomycetia bacterium TMED53]|nr:MAG: hypothetical protein CBC13_10615 [Planctomycetia bacterium TMED53]
MPQEITIKVGFGNQFRELTVRIQDDDVKPWQPSDRLHLIGQSYPRVDAVAKVTGTARYAYDQQPEGMIYGKILRSSHANSDIVSIDTKKASQMPGVKAVLTVPDVFEDQTARYAGAEIAAVAATTEAQAEAALRAIEVEYDIKPHSVTVEDSLKEDAPQVGRGSQKNVVRTSPRMGRRGGGNADSRLARQEAEVKKLIDEADASIEAEFRTEVQTHAPLETHGGVCTWEDGRLIFWASSQATFGFRNEMTSGWSRVKAKDCQVLAEFVGGGFGSKFSAGREGVLGALLSKEAGVPVHMMLDRSGEQLSAGNRPDSIQQMKMGVNKDGQIVGTRIRSWGTPGAGTGGAGAHNDAIYNIGETDKIEYGVRTNTGGARAHRAPGWPQGAFALEQMMDMAAEEIGMDRVEFRKKNDDHPIRSVEYDIAKQRIGWDKVGSSTDKTKRTGVGIASNLWFSAGGGGASALVRISKDGQVEVRNGAQDIGTGTRTVMGMVVAEELGLDLEQVTTRIGNTDDPKGPASGGSTTIGTITPAARLAAHHAKRQLLEIVAERKGWNASELDLKDQEVHQVGKGSTNLNFKDACALMDDDAIEVLKGRPRRNYEGFCDTNAGVQAATVEIDEETGEVKVKKVVAVADAGKIINPLTSESQVRGGVIQGVSFALFERRIMDRQKGRMLNDDLENYKILGAADCPVIDVVLLDVFNGKSNTQVMGLGEPPIVATAAAVANAVSDALGVRIYDLPITPKKVLEAIARRDAARGADSESKPKQKGERL